MCTASASGTALTPPIPMSLPNSKSASNVSDFAAESFGATANVFNANVCDVPCFAAARKRMVGSDACGTSDAESAARRSRQPTDASKATSAPPSSSIAAETRADDKEDEDEEDEEDCSSICSAGVVAPNAARK